MSAARIALLALLAGLAALPGCGRKGTPDRPPAALPVEPATEPEGDDDRFFGNPPPPPAETAPDVEEEVDDQLAG